MSNTRRISKLHGLYAITDETLIPDRNFASTVEQALSGGAAIIQYRRKHTESGIRNKQARSLRELCTRYHALLIINDDVDLATAVDADGVHLGADDTGIREARTRLGDDSIIGASCYNRLELAETAISQGADYVAFGAAFASPTKPGAVRAAPELFRTAKQLLDKPVCAIGGITAQNAAEIVACDVDMVAVISGVFAQNDVEAAARQIVSLYH